MAGGMAEGAAKDEPPLPVPGPNGWFVLGLSFLVFSAVGLVVGVVLFTACSPFYFTGPYGGGTFGCVYPFLSSSCVSFYLAFLLLLASLGAFTRDRTVRGHGFDRCRASVRGA